MTTQIADKKLLEGLTGAIRRLYEVFAIYPHQGMVPGCPCCVTAEDMQRLNSKSLQQLTGEDLGRYARKAITTWGRVEDLKHFLPRLLELLATDFMWGMDDEVLIRKLSYAGWHEWPAVEQDAVTAFLREWWRSIIGHAAGEGHFYDTNECLCAIGQVVNNLQPFLEDWSQNDSTASLYELAQVVERNANCLMNKRRLSNPFWDERKEQMEQVIAWLLEPARKEALEMAFFEDMTGPHAQDFSYAVELWDGIVSASRSA